MPEIKKRPRRRSKRNKLIIGNIFLQNMPYLPSELASRLRSLKEIPISNLEMLIPCIQKNVGMNLDEMKVGIEEQQSKMKGIGINIQFDHIDILEHQGYQQDKNNLVLDLQPDHYAHSIQAEIAWALRNQNQVDFL